jgi:trans-2,3-dihydro-3-hydroxyanthranilate isomerase
MTQRPASFRAGRCERQKLAAALGLRASDLHAKLPVEAVSTGIFNVMVPLARPSALGRIELNIPALRKVLGRRHVMAYCFHAQKQQVRARGMLPWGIAEDPATGSSAGSLGAYLVRHRQLEPGQLLRITQGVEMGRPSEIFVNVSRIGARLVPRVSGAAVRVFEGLIEE